MQNQNAVTEQTEGQILDLTPFFHLSVLLYKYKQGGVNDYEIQAMHRICNYLGVQGFDFYSFWKTFDNIQKKNIHDVFLFNDTQYSNKDIHKILKQLSKQKEIDVLNALDYAYKLGVTDYKYYVFTLAFKPETSVKEQIDGLGLLLDTAFTKGTRHLESNSFCKVEYFECSPSETNTIHLWDLLKDIYPDQEQSDLALSQLHENFGKYNVVISFHENENENYASLDILKALNSLMAHLESKNKHISNSDLDDGFDFSSEYAITSNSTEEPEIDLKHSLPIDFNTTRDKDKTNLHNVTPVTKKALFPNKTDNDTTNPVITKQSSQEPLKKTVSVSAEGIDNTVKNILTQTKSMVRNLLLRFNKSSYIFEEKENPVKKQTTQHTQQDKYIEHDNISQDNSQVVPLNNFYTLNYDVSSGVFRYIKYD